MDSWSNIEVLPDDPEITAIDKMEQSLGELPSNVRRVRELITRIEICHFKIQRHCRFVKESVACLHPVRDSSGIGSNHIKNGAIAIRRDTTGRSAAGQRYIEALNQWLETGDHPGDSRHDRDPFTQQVFLWLGDPDPGNVKVVRLLIARLMWDWESYKMLNRGKAYKALKEQACRTDICHYAFPENLESLLRGIGKMEPVDGYEGCGSFNPGLKAFAEKEFSKLNGLLRSAAKGQKKDKDELSRTWLTACFAKTIKEQTGLTKHVEALMIRK